MAKPKRKLTPQQKAEKARRRREYMTIFIRGKQKRVKRPPLIDGISVEEFIRNNADDLWYHQNEIWEEIGQHETIYSVVPELEDEELEMDADDLWGPQHEVLEEIGEYEAND